MKNQTELVVKKLINEKKYNFNLYPKKSILDDIAQNLDLLSLGKLSFIGQISCIKNVDLKLEATLRAVVTQKCVVTLVPVQSEIVSKVERLFIKGWTNNLPSSSETMLETVKEVQTDKINLLTIIVEELSLEVPTYPRVERPNEFLINPQKYTSKISDEAVNNPFAILSNFKKEMESQNDDNE